MLRWKTSVAAFVGVMVIASLAAAATIAVTPTITASFDPTTGALQSNTFIQGGAHIYRVDLLMNVASAATNEAFGATSFDIGLTGGASRNTLTVAGPPLSTPKPNYSANDPAMTVLDGSTFNPIATTFAGGQNGDLGTPADLIALTQAINPANLNNVVDGTTFLPTTDPRMGLGKTTAFNLGSVYIKFDGATTGHFILQNGSMSIANATTHLLGNTTPLTGSDLVIPVPEPTSIALLGLGAIGLVGMKIRRR